MAAAIFPAYAAIQNQPEILRRSFLATVRFVEILCVPLAVGLVLVADPLVRVAFGGQWLAAIPIVRILALFVLVRSIGFNAGDVYKAMGRPDILVKLEVLNMAILAPALWFGASFGLLGVAWGHLLASLVRMTADAVIATRFIQLGPKDILLQLKPAFLGGVALALGVLPSLYLTAEAAPVVRLAVAIPIGAASYLGVLWILEQASLVRIGRMLGLPGLGKGPVSASLALSATPDGEAG
jgi:O-antigen/teichoic acid export membrane protein